MEVLSSSTKGSTALQGLEPPVHGIFRRPIEATRVNTTGAGDAFMAALVDCSIKGFDKVNLPAETIEYRLSDEERV